MLPLVDNLLHGMSSPPFCAGYSGMASFTLPLLGMHQALYDRSGSKPPAQVTQKWTVNMR